MNARALFAARTVLAERVDDSARARATNRRSRTNPRAAARADRDRSRELPNGCPRAGVAASAARPSCTSSAYSVPQGRRQCTNAREFQVLLLARRDQRCRRSESAAGRAMPRPRPNTHPTRSTATATAEPALRCVATREARRRVRPARRHRAARPPSAAPSRRASAYGSAPWLQIRRRQAREVRRASPLSFEFREPLASLAMPSTGSAPAACAGV